MHRLFFLISFPILLAGCAETSSHDPKMEDTAVAFIAFVEEGKLDEAHSLLSSEARSKLSPAELRSDRADFQVLIDAFRSANINVRTKPPKNEPSFYVRNVDGKKGAVRFVMVKEGSEWKIANLLADPEPFQ